MSDLICDVPIQSISVADGLRDPILLQQQFFTHGFVHISGVVQGEELAVLQRETDALLRLVRSLQPEYQQAADCPDGVYNTQLKRWVQQQVDNYPPAVQDTYYYKTEKGLAPGAIDFIPAHAQSARALLGHPKVLQVVEALQGKEFILGATPMVVKFPEDGTLMPWHRDGLRPADVAEERATFTAGIYLDDAVDETAVRIVPGTHRWSKEAAGKESGHRNEHGIFNDEGCVIARPKAGDLLIHHTWVLHGSPACTGPMRRVIYESFTPKDIAAELLTDTQLHLAHRRIHMGIMERQYLAYCKDEEPYNYNCNLSDHTVLVRRWQELDAWRLHHGGFLRNS